MYETADGDLPGKVDVPIARVRGSELWAPTVRPVRRAGFAFHEERVVVAVDLEAPLPAAARRLDVRPAATLEASTLRRL